MAVARFDEQVARVSRHMARAYRLISFPSSLGYGIALGTIAAILLLWLLAPDWSERLSYSTLAPAVALSAWIGGSGPGLASTAASGADAATFWDASFGMWPGWLGLLVFLSIGTLLSLSESTRRDAATFKQAEQFFDATLKSIADAVVTTDTDGRVTRLNRAAEALTGWPASEAIGRPVQEIVVVLDELSRRPASIQDSAGAAKGALLVSRDRREVAVDLIVSSILAASGVSEGTIIVIRDVAERRQQESRNEAQFRLTRELAAIVESSDDAIISKDLESTIRSWNRGAERMFGYTADEIIGQSIRTIIPADRMGEEDDVVSRLRRGEKIDHFETVRRRKDGHEFPVSLTISPIHAPNGSVVGASKIVRDISQQKQLESERAGILLREQEARVALEQASRAKDDFLAVLSHELRTPLNAVIGYTHLLNSGTLTSEQAGQALQAIQRNAYAQSRLLESLVDLSRIMAGKLELEMEEIDLVRIVGLAVDTVRPQASSKSVAVEFSDSAHPPISLVGDSTRLHQVFLNLLSNAIKFTPRGGHVRVELRPGLTDVEVRVTDDGQGIGASFLPRVFERFAQEDRQRARSGLGLGLALVKEIVHAHGGRVRAESQGEGFGSVFTIALPLPVATWFAADADRRNAPPASLSGLSLMVVDDEPDALRLATLILTTRGAAVRTAESTAEAFEALVQTTPDVLLADIGLPGQDGYALIRSYREYERRESKKRLPAIAVTAYASPQDGKRAMAAGYDLHVPKPVDFDLLIGSIARLAKSVRPS
jgi:PAS domain S-box-containing protein